MLKKICKELEQKTIEDEKMISELNINVTNLSMNEKLHYREACENHEERKLHFSHKLIYLPVHNFLVKEIVDRHTKEIEDLQNKLAAGLATGGGGDGVDIDALRNLFASKTPPDNTIVRIEELEKINSELLANVMKHEKTLYQNNTLEDLKNDDSKNKVKGLMQEAQEKDRHSQKGRDSQGSIHDKDDA